MRWFNPSLPASYFFPSELKEMTDTIVVTVTQEMLDAGADAWAEWLDNEELPAVELARMIFERMLAASPASFRTVTAGTPPRPARSP